MTDHPDPHSLPPPVAGTALTDGAPAAGAPRKRRRLVIVTAVVLAVLIAGVGALMLVDRTVLRHDLLEADFDAEAKPFRVGSSPEYEFSLAAGGYRITAVAGPTSPAAAFAWFRRHAYNVDITAELVAVQGFGKDTAAGIGCEDKPNSNGHGYEFTVSANTYRIVRTDGSAPALLASSPSTRALDGRVTRLRVTCSPLPGNFIEIRGYVDGVEVIQATDPNGLDVFRSVVLILEADAIGQQATFDNVVAVVPGE